MKSFPDVPRTFTTPEIRIDCPDHIKFHVVEEVVRALEKTIKLSMSHVDVFGDGWGLVRPSNTQPVLYFGLRP